MRRLLMGVAALTTVALPISVAVVVAAPAANAGVSLTCAKIKGSETGSVTVLKCSVSKADKKTYKEATVSNAAALVAGGTLHWSSSGATTIVSAPTLSTPPAGTCSAKDTAERATGSVTGGSSAVTHAGDTFKATVCISKSGKISEAKGVPVDL
jgi:hypothetical protein